VGTDLYRQPGVVRATGLQVRLAFEYLLYGFNLITFPFWAPVSFSVECGWMVGHISFSSFFFFFLDSVVHFFSFISIILIVQRSFI
jgi:hypothetical protein